MFVRPAGPAAARAAAVAVAAIGVLSATVPRGHEPHSPLAGKQVASLPVTLTPAASASIAASRRDLWPVRRGGALVAKGGGIHSAFTPSGAALGVGGGTLQIALAAFGREHGMRAVPPAPPRARRNQVIYRRGAVSELYGQGPFGVEQAFAIRSRPRYGEGRMQLTLRLGGSLIPRQVGSRLVFDAPGGPIALHYGQLVATDAAGKRLPAQMILRDRALDVRIDDTGARYPVTVDPFIQQGEKLTGGGEIGGGLFGTSVALSADGNTALIGGAADGEGTGGAWVFTRSGSTWTQQGEKLTGGGAEGQSGFGSSVALSADGNTALIGGPQDNGHKGAAWVFIRSGSTWTQQGTKLTGAGRSGKAEFGSSVALSADANTALIGGLCDGAHTEGTSEFTCEPTGKGAAWVFTRSGSTWSQQGEKLTGGGEVGGGLFGASVAISSDGNTALIGAILDNSSKGAAWVFTRSGSTWTQQGEKLTGGLEEVGAGRFGGVALSGDGETALVGAYRDSAGKGAAWVFTRSGSTWSQQGAKLTGGLEEVGAGRFGSVSLSGDGDTALIGAPGDNEEAGAAWEFTRSGSTWKQQEAKLTSSGELGAGNFGSSVALSQDASTALIGGPSDGFIAPTPESKGAAWVFFQGASAATEAASAETQTSATLHGKVNPNGDETECEFEYGTTAAYGSSAECSTPPGSGEEPVVESASIAGLSANTTYHFRIVATNASGTSHGADVTFKTLPEPPAAVTEPASQITQTTATLNAQVNPHGGALGECKLEYGTTTAYGASAPCSPEPGSAEAPVAVGAPVAGLTPSTTYHFRLFAKNAGGTTFGEDETLKTLAPTPPVVVTGTASSVTDSSATVDGTVNPRGAEVTACKFEYGPSTAYGSSAPCASLPGAGSSPVAVSAPLTGLSALTTYHFRVVAKNALGTSEGEDKTFKTLPEAPGVLTQAPEPLAQTTATLRATVNPHGGNVSECKFEYGPTASYGQSAACSSLPGEGTSPVAVSAAIGSLSANTTYHFRLIAKNVGGTSSSSDAELKTLPEAPGVLTQAPEPLAQTTATLRATVNPHGGNVSECKFEYGPTASYGQSAACSSLPGEGTSPVAVSAAIASLSANTTYHFRLIAKNTGGTSSSSDAEFKTLPEAPGVLTQAPSPIAQTTATLRGTVNPHGGNVSECKLEYGSGETLSQSAACSSLPGEGTSAVAVSAAVTGLSPTTTYHFRLVASNAGGTGTSAQGEFTTLAPLLPTAVTQPATSVTHTAAALNATVNPNGANVTTCTFEYGTTTAYGSSAPCSSLPGAESAPTAVSAPIAGLSATTTYHFRVVAANVLGKGEGTDQTFTTAQAPPEAPSPPAGAPGPSGGPPPAAPPTPAVPDVKLVGRALAVTASGAFKVKLTCPATEISCTGTIVFRSLTAVAAGAGRATGARKSILTLAHASFSIAGGRAATVKLTLSAKARALLVRSRTLKAKATIIGRDPAGATHRRESTVTLLAPKGKSAKR